MISASRGFCPFRVAKPNFQAGCVLQLGKDAFCYTRDQRPLMRREETHEKYFYTCPLVTKMRLSSEIYEEIDKIVKSILIVQDEQELTINLWPIFCRSSKITNPKEDSETAKGKEIQLLSQKVRDELQEIVLNLT
ncbi:MAG: hypothetical protein ACXADY_22190 [Candidatus Hodarchaeales archaeon]|jgi:hypothetical protein